MHQIDVPVLEARCTHQLKRLTGVITRMNAAESAQRAIVKTLHTDTESGYACFKIRLVSAPLSTTGVTLQGDFSAWGKGHALCQTGKQALYPLPREQAGGAATEKNGFDKAPANLWQLTIKILK